MRISGEGFYFRVFCVFRGKKKEFMNLKLKQTGGMKMKKREFETGNGTTQSKAGNALTPGRSIEAWILVPARI